MPEVSSPVLSHTSDFEFVGSTVHVKLLFGSLSFLCIKYLNIHRLQTVISVSELENACYNRHCRFSEIIETNMIYFLLFKWIREDFIPNISKFLFHRWKYHFLSLE